MRCQGLLLCGLLLSLPAWAGDPDILVLGMMPDRAILKVDGQQLVLRKGEDHEGLQLVSINSSRATLRVNGQLRQYGLGSDTSMVSTSQAREQNVDIRANATGDYLAHGAVNGQSVDFIVDSSVDTLTLSSADADALGLAWHAAPTGWERRGGSLGKVWLLTLDSVRVGGITLHGVAAAVHEGADTGHLVLGRSFLDQVTVTREHRLMRLTSR